MGVSINGCTPVHDPFFFGIHDPFIDGISLANHPAIGVPPSHLSGGQCRGLPRHSIGRWPDEALCRA